MAQEEVGGAWHTLNMSCVPGILHILLLSIFTTTLWDYGRDSEIRIIIIPLQIRNWGSERLTCSRFLSYCVIFKLCIFYRTNCLIVYLSLGNECARRLHVWDAKQLRTQPRAIGFFPTFPCIITHGYCTHKESQKGKVGQTLNTVEITLPTMFPPK